VSRLTIVIPALDEGAVIEDLLRALQPLRGQGVELILVDGGSRDGTPERARPLVDRVLSSRAGRARQMNQGAREATGEWLWFLHADTRLGASPEAYLRAMLHSRRDWGRFDVRLDAPGGCYRLIAFMMNWRSRLTGVVTGDQGLFVRRCRFEALGGFASIPLMEDIELSRRLRRVQWPASPRLALWTSARRWRQHGVWRTVLLMWRLRLAYFLGVPPQRLARYYRQCSSPTPES
jgi:rSAM/selenodomain-associated transferase 2